MGIYCKLFIRLTANCNKIMKCATVKGLLFICCLCLVNCKIPNYIKRCKKNGELSKCLLENYNNVAKYLVDNDGDSSLKVPNLGRFFVPIMDISATKELPITLANLTMIGLSTYKLKDVTMTNTEITLIGHLDSFSFTGQYEMKGRILIVPIEGSGNMNITVTNFDIKYKATLKTEERNGKSYYYVDNNPDDTKTSVNKIAHVYFNFDNLFGGDPKLGPEMNKFLNENWQDIFNEVQAAYEQSAAFHVFNTFINAYLRRIPIDELFEK